MKKNLAIILEFGFHEIKKYIHSGFAASLAHDFNVTWFALNKGSKEFDDYFKSTGFPIVYFNENDFKNVHYKIENYNQSVRRNWVANKDLGAFHNYSQVRKKSLKSRLIGNSLFKYFFENRTLKWIKEKYYNQQLADKFKKYEIDIVFITSYASTFVKSNVITAQKERIKTFYLVNSWKDLYINNFLPFRGLSAIFVWSEKMKQDYISQTPYLKKERFVVSGNPTFDVLLNIRPTHSRAYYAEKYKIPEHANWLLYTMMPIGLANDEIETIRFTAEKIYSNFDENKFIILIRKNPTHHTDDFLDMKLPGNVRVMEHFCSFDKEADMMVQSKEGELEWLDLLQHCSANLSVPSTVTLEFMTLSKPVLNIAYNSSGEKDGRIVQFFEAGFYRPLFETKEVTKIDKPEEIIDFLLKTPLLVEGNEQEVILASSIIIETLKKR